MKLFFPALFNFESNLYLEPSKEVLLTRLGKLGAWTYPIYSLVFIFLVPHYGLAIVYLILTLLSLAVSTSFLRNLLTLRRWVIVLAFWFSVVSAAVVLGRDSHCHLWFLSGIGIGFLIFPTDKKLQIGLSTLLTAGSYLFFSSSGYPAPFLTNVTIDQYAFLTTLNITLSSIVAFLCYVYLYISFSETHRLVISQRDALSQTSRMASLGELSSGVAHEINNPLTVILVKSELLLTKGENFSQKQVDDLQKIIHHGNRISSIVNSLKLFSNNLDDDLVKTNVVSVVSACIDLFIERTKKVGIDLSFEAAEKELFILGNSKQLAQVVVNILNNAIEAVQKLTPGNSRWVKVIVKKVAHSIEIDFIDSGAGVNEKFKDKLKEPFFTTKIVGDGAGLGLSISQGIVKSFKGTLELIDSSDTLFRVSLPIYSISQPTTLPPSK